MKGLGVVLVQLRQNVSHQWSLLDEEYHARVHIKQKDLADEIRALTEEIEKTLKLKP